ncbi:hypothetical protein [Teichococcus aestuarii]
MRLNDRALGVLTLGLGGCCWRPPCACRACRGRSWGRGSSPPSWAAA